MRSFYLFLLLLFTSLAFPQQLREKTLILNAGAFNQLTSSSIEVLNTRYTDSNQDAALLTEFVKLRFAATPRYALFAFDTTRYAAILFRAPLFNRYLITHYYQDGSILSMARYKPSLLRTGPYLEFHKGYHLKTQGAYRNGVKKGKWKYYNEAGKLIKKEIYRKGTIKRNKELQRPRRTYYSLFFNGAEPIQYRISELNDTTPALFKTKKYQDYARIGGFCGFIISEYITDMSGLRSDPYMLNLPSNNAFMFGAQVSVGDRRKIFVTGDLIMGGITNKNADYNNYRVDASNAVFRYNFTANVPILGRKKTNTLFLFCGTGFARMFPTSKTVLNNGQTTSYYVAAEIHQDWLLNTGLLFDHIIDAGRHSFFTSLFVKAGYNFSFSDPAWYSSLTQPRTKLSGLAFYPVGQDLPSINMGGFYVTLGLNTWRGKMKRSTGIQ